MIADTLGSVLLYLMMIVGLAWPLAARLACPAPEKLLASAALSLLGIFLFAWAVYVLALPRPALWGLPVLSALALASQWQSVRALWRDRDTRDLIIAQLIVTSWCIGWLALVVTYSGGNWVGDWFGHWQRAVFFLDRGPRDILFNGFDALTSRPPLANIVYGVFMTVTRNDFAHYQLATTVFGSLAFLPAALLARRFGGWPATHVLAVLFMLSPMFVQNATFAWTKLPAAFFTLAAIHWFLRAHDSEPSPAGPLCAATLGAALLTHYSAGPYAVVLVGAWFALGWVRRGSAAWWKKTALAGLVGAAVLASWFAWALAIYGVKGTFLTNSSITDKAPSGRGQLWAAALNVRDTVVPHFLRDLDYAYIGQSSVWGWWRDWFFQLYQINLFFIFGSVAWLVLAVALWKVGRSSPPRVRLAWAIAITSTMLQGIVVHGGRDGWGLAHICLQPVVLLGLAFLAARWNSLGRTWRRVIGVGAAVDFTLGIALQFGAQSYLLDQWLAPGRPPVETFFSYSPHAIVNLRAKSHFKWSFFGDGFAAHDIAVLVFLGLLLAAALALSARRDART